MKKHAFLIPFLVIFFAVSNISATNEKNDEKPTEKLLVDNMSARFLAVPAGPTEICEVVCRFIPQPTCRIKCLYTTTCVELEGVSVKCNGDTTVLCSEECPPPEN